jgi:hypothetical protein
VADGSERNAVPDRWTATAAGYGMWIDMALDLRIAKRTEPEGERATLLKCAGSLRPGGLAPADQGLDAVQDRLNAEQELLPFLEARRAAAEVRGPGEPVQPRVGLLVG